MTTKQVRTRRLARSQSVGPVLAAASLGLAVATGASAHADAIDNAFLGAIHSKGINFASPQAAVIAGHEVCDELDLGRQKPDIANEVMSSSNLDGYRAGFFVGASVAAYCPRHHS
jgi:hypothetical protein